MTDLEILYAVFIVILLIVVAYEYRASKERPFDLVRRLRPSRASRNTKAAQSMPH